MGQRIGGVKAGSTRERQERRIRIAQVNQGYSKVRMRIGEIRIDVRGTNVGVPGVDVISGQVQSKTKVEVRRRIFGVGLNRLLEPLSGTLVPANRAEADAPVHVVDLGRCAALFAGTLFHGLGLLASGAAKRPYGNRECAQD